LLHPVAPSHVKEGLHLSTHHAEAGWNAKHEAIIPGGPVHH
jgi:hypothetical protein